MTSCTFSPKKYDKLQYQMLFLISIKSDVMMILTTSWWRRTLEWGGRLVGESKWSAVSEKARQEPLHQIDEDECGEEDQDRGMIILIMGWPQLMERISMVCDLHPICLMLIDGKVNRDRDFASGRYCWEPSLETSWTPQCGEICTLMTWLKF